MPTQSLISKLSDLWASRRATVRGVGNFGEKAAVSHLKSQNYRVIARNLRSRVGEVDILAIAPDGRTVVVVEVKASGGASRSAYPEIHVNKAKQRKLATLALGLVKRYRLENRPIRIDVIAVTRDADGSTVVRHHPSAVEAAG